VDEAKRRIAENGCEVHRRASWNGDPAWGSVMTFVISAIVFLRFL